MERFVPLSIPNFEGNEEKYVLDAVHQGWVSTGGAYITKLEELLAEFLQVKKVVACQSGTAALHLALMECGVQPGDLVIVPTLTFIAAVNPVRYQFADPVFIDCDDSLCMDPVKLRKFCETECELRNETQNDRDEAFLAYRKSGQRIRAIVVVHVFGNLADMEAIMDIAKEYHLRVVEDATEALGSAFTAGRYAGKMAGTIGDFGAYSFNGNKIITTGGGGAITAADPKELEHIHYISTQAKDDPLFYVHDEIGYNYRMTNLQAALGVAQMEELPEFIRRKTDNYRNYQKMLADTNGGYLQKFRAGTRPNYWFYSLVLEDEVIARVGGIQGAVEQLRDKGIQTRPVWGLIHQQKPYQRSIAYEIEKALYYSKRIINIPSSTQLTDEDLKYVVECIKEIVLI